VHHQLAAMRRGLISLEGLGGADYLHVRVRNLSSDRIEICVTSPTILLGDEGYPTADLKKIYPQLAGILTQAGGTASVSGNEDLETHLKIQERIWAAVAAQTLIFALYFLRHRFPALDISYLWYNLIGCATCVVFSLMLQATLSTKPVRAANS